MEDIEISPVQIGATNLLRDLHSYVCAEFRVLPKAWADMTDEEREQVEDRAFTRIEAAANACAATLNTLAKTHLRGTFVKATIKDNIVCQIDISRNDPARHELLDRAGKDVLVVLLAPELDGQRPKVDPTLQMFDEDGNPIDPDDGDPEDPDSVAGMAALDPPLFAEA